MKSYIRYFFKNRIPLFIIILSVLLIVGVTSASGLSFVEQWVQRDYYVYYNYRPTDAGVAPLAFTVCIIMVILPLFNMGYRYSLSKTDLFRQTAQNKKAYRYVDHGLSVAFVLAAYTISFALFLLVAVIKNYAQPIPQNNSMYHYYRVYFNYGPYFYIYLLTLLFAVGNYFITYFFASRSNNLINSLILVVLGQLFLGSFCILFAEMGGTNENYFMYLPCANASVSFGPLFLDFRYTGWIINGDKSYTDALYGIWYVNETEAILTTLSSFIVFFITAATGVVFFFAEKDPSGEWAGKPDTSDAWQDVLYNLFVGTLLTWMLYSYIKNWYYNTAMALAISLVVTIAIYYTLYGLLRRNFKPKQYQIIAMVCTMVMVIAVSMFIFGCNGFKPHVE